MAVKMRIIANLSPLSRPTGNQWQWKTKKIIENECTKNNGFEVIYFSFISSNKRGENGKKIWVPVRDRTTDLWIRRCEALPLKTLQWARPVLSYKFGDFETIFFILCVRTKPSFDPRAMLILTPPLYLPNVLIMDCSQVSNVKTQCH